MIIHRDYRSSADSLIKIFPHHIIFYNPGVPENITIEQLLSDDYISLPRNRQIAQMVKEIGLIEKYGTGIKRVCNLFADYNLPTPEFKIVQGGFFVKVLDTQPTILKSDLKSSIPEKLEDVPLNVPLNVPINVPLNERQTKLIDLIMKESNINLEELSDRLQVNLKTIKRDIQELKKNNLIERTGSKKSGYWQVKK